MANLSTENDDSKPAPADASSALHTAQILFEQGRWLDAEAHFILAQQDAATSETAALQLARCAAKRGEPMLARERFAALLRSAPQNVDAWLEAGHVCHEQRVIEQALGAYQRALTLAPQRWDVYLALACALEDSGQFGAAAAAYHRATASAGAGGSAADPATTPRKVHWHMAKFRLKRGDAPRALEAMRQALLAGRLEKPAVALNERAEMQIDLADIFMRLGMTNEAHRAFERASAASSEATLVRLADVSFRYNLWAEAEAVLRRNVQLHRESARAHWNLAHALAESSQMEAALLALDKAESIAPMPGAPSMRASIAGRMGDAETALRLYRALADKEGPHSKIRSCVAMSALYSDQRSAQEVADLHRTLFKPLGEGARARASFKNSRIVDRPLRVGLVTADFHHQHPVNIFMQPVLAVLARLDRQAIELSVYFTGVSYDEQTQLARQRAAHWVECSAWSDAALARHIEADGIDILIDLAGHTARQRMSLFAHRAAPVQATFLGYPASTGVPNIDWIIADAVVAPSAHAALYSERIMRLPNTVFCFAPEADYPFPDYGPAQTQRPLTFGSFNNVPKLTPHTLQLWAQVLHATPNSRLLLKAPSFKDAAAVRLFSERFQAAGIAAERLEFRGPVGLNEMMAEYADVDIALDPVPYNGGTTTLQALWMGVPVVVKEGENFVSRMGASFMRAAGLPEWVAANDADYVAIARRMAADRQALLKLKRELRDRLKAAPGWDIDIYTRDLEVALRAMWADWCADNA
jgi:protein O-GlcNAc transferase